MIKFNFYPSGIFIGSVIALKKANKVEPRPITIPEAFDKLLSRIILKLEKDAYQLAIPNTQYGVAYNQNPNSELYVIQTDISGAFNSVKRQQLLNLLADYKMSEIGSPLSPSNFSAITNKLINDINTQKQSQFDQTLQLKSIANYTEWIKAIYGYMDDMFIFASSQQQAQDLIEMGQRELLDVNMSFDFSKCHALCIRQGLIQPNIPPIQTDYGRICFDQSLDVLGIPISQSGLIRDQKFIKLATTALRTADSATLLYSQNALNIERFCVASKLTRFVQLTKKISNFSRLRGDTVRQMLSIPIKLGGTGIISLEDIQHPALLATYYELIQEPQISQLLQQADLIGNLDINPNYQQKLSLMLHPTQHTGRLYEFFAHWQHALQILQSIDCKITQHALWYRTMKNAFFTAIDEAKVLGIQKQNRIIGSDGYFSGAHLAAIGASKQT
ncbi:MAG: hypothetical protein EZS28_039868 [Streblomastix strix]|uniref:Reverse transcriptase domain-containing protein n=1 Tax=Streblomastix strix TaxID=222440 RepID=A0A5J4U4L8_9EUKA|nr:MAG: hypothetical protein EZS28_039868 [Streblomastix strix]